MFARCLKELVADNDEVAVPHLGVFHTQKMPASFSDNLSTINPPYRKVSFCKRAILPEESTLVISKVASTMGVPAEQASVELDWCLSRLSSELEGAKSCDLPGFGKMKSNSSNDFFFVPDEDLDIFTEGLGFEAIHLRIAPDVVPEPIPELSPFKESAAESVPEEIDEPVPEEINEPAPEEFEVNVQGHAKDSGKHSIWLVIAIVAVVLISACIVFYFLCPQEASDLLDNILYTEEELELIRGNW